MRRRCTERRHDVHTVCSQCKFCLLWNDCLDSSDIGRDQGLRQTVHKLHFQPPSAISWNTRGDGNCSLRTVASAHTVQWIAEEAETQEQHADFQLDLEEACRDQFCSRWQACTSASAKQSAEQSSYGISASAADARTRAQHRSAQRRRCISRPVSHSLARQLSRCGIYLGSVAAPGGGRRCVHSPPPAHFAALTVPVALLLLAPFGSSHIPLSSREHEAHDAHVLRFWPWRRWNPHWNHGAHRSGPCPNYLFAIFAICTSFRRSPCASCRRPSCLSVAFNPQRGPGATTLLPSPPQ